MLSTVQPGRIAKHHTHLTTAAEYCLNLIRTHDYENYICTLLLRNPLRSRAIAIRSFNVEIAKVAEQIRTTNLGAMRMKFWTDVLDVCYSETPSTTSDVKLVPKHPVALELCKAIRGCKELSRDHFDALIESRTSQLGKYSFASLREVEQYADMTMGRVYALLMEATECANDSQSAQIACRRLGRAHTIVQQLRTLPKARQVNFIGLPDESLHQLGLNRQDVLRANRLMEIRDCVFEVASRARLHLREARAVSDSIPKKARVVLLPALTVSAYLDKLEAVHHDAFHPDLMHREVSLYTKMWWSKVRKRY